MKSAFVLALAVLAVSVHANPRGMPASMPEQYASMPEGPLYRGVAPSAAPPAVSALELAQGLPAFSPSTLPPRFYDQTEYEVSPLQMPLSLPTPPPPPSMAMIEQGAARRNALSVPATAAATATSAAAIHSAAVAAAEAALRASTAQSAGAMSPAFQRLAQRTAAPQPPVMQQQMQQQMPAAPSFLQQTATTHRTAQSQRRAEAVAAAANLQKQKHTTAHKHHSSHRAHNRARHMSGAGLQVQAQKQKQTEFERFADRMRFARRPTAPAAPSFMELQTQTRAVASARAQHMQQQLASMQAQAAAFQRQLALQKAYMNAPHPDQRAQAMASRPQRPFMGDAPQSVSARGFVPHFAPAVRAVPSGQPFQPYAGFFEAAAQTQAAVNPYAGRPQEPFLPRLPPPPIVLGE